MANKKNKSKKNSLPTTVEVFEGMRSELAVAAFQRSGGGFHADKRDRKERKNDWKRDEW